MRKRKATGKCFVQSYNLLMEFGDDARLVHGIVWGDNGTGWHIHGWVEMKGLCWDYLGGQLTMVPQARYYEIGKVKTGKGEIFKYTKEEAIKESLKVNKYYFSKLPCDQ